MPAFAAAHDSWAAEAELYRAPTSISGQVVAWGTRFAGELTNVPPAAQSGVQAVAAGPYHSLALKQDGTVVAWGPMFENNIPVPATVPKSLNGVTAIATARLHSVALKQDGTAVEWGGIHGYLYYQDASAPSGLPRIVAIAVGDNHTVALLHDGRVASWGFVYSSPGPHGSDNNYAPPLCQRGCTR